MRVIISGGGTGGHIFPAIAVAQELKRKVANIDILFVGAIGKMEMEKVPGAGFSIRGLWISGMHRKLTFRNLLFPFKLIFSLIQSFLIISRFKPDIIISFGGYASGPVSQVGLWKGIPLVLQEQNSYPGITNKILAGKAKKICVAYEGMDKYFDKNKIVLTGNPVRKDISERDKDFNSSLSHFELIQNRKTALIFGGSLGARSLNEAMRTNLDSIIGENSDIQIIWQAGSLYYNDYARPDIVKNKAVRILPFIDRMDKAYEVADLVVCRAGALAISELSICGKPAILVPSPNVAEDHQTKNAMNLVERNAALMIKDSEVSAKLGEIIVKTINDDVLMKTLSENIKKLARPDAASIIADIVTKECLKK